MNERHEIAVIGGGIVGVSTALHLQMRGAKVLLIDRGPPEQATSFGNAGIIEASYVLPFAFPAYRRFFKIGLNRDPSVHIHYLHLLKCLGWIVDFHHQSQPAPRRIHGELLRPLVANAVAEHRHLMQGTEAENYLTKAGRVKLHRSDKSFHASTVERDAARDMGVPFEVMTAAEFSAIEPDLKPVYAKAVRWTSSMRLTNPGAVVAGYAARFLRDGGVIVTDEVVHLNDRGENGWHIKTRRGDYDAAQIVLCTGPWADKLFKPLGYRFPLGIKRGYHQHFAAKNSARLSHAILDADIGYVLSGMEHGYRLTTGAEFADHDASPTPVQIRQSLPYARQLFDLGDAIDARPWLGSRPCFPDSLPVVGPAPEHKNLWFNFGHGHSGLTTGPATGRLLAEMMRGEKPFCDPMPYRAERF